MGRLVSIVGKIMARVELNAQGCWEWQGPTSGNGRGGGYPRVSIDGHTSAAHRVMFVCFHGYVPSKKHLDHTCRNRLCVNPDHLELVTHKENCRRRDAASNQLNREG